MDGAAENGAEHNPEIRSRAELRAHNGTEDWPESRDVEKLNHEDFPGGQGNEIDAVGPCQGRRRVLWIDVNDTGNVSSVDKVTRYEDCYGDEECVHALCFVCCDDAKTLVFPIYWTIFNLS